MSVYQVITGDCYLTVDRIMSLKPCPNWTRERVAELFGDRERATIAEILRCNEVDREDRIWLACQPGVLPVAIRSKWINGIADRAVRAHCLNCGIENVETWAAAWLSGEDRTADTAWSAVEEAWSAVGAWSAEAGAAAHAARAGYAAAERVGVAASSEEVARVSEAAEPPSTAAAAEGRQVNDLLAMIGGGA